MRLSFPVNLQAVGLPFLWKWASVWIIPKCFAYFIIFSVNDFFFFGGGGGGLFLRFLGPKGLEIEYYYILVSGT